MAHRSCRRSPASATVGLALLPLIAAQVNPTHIGWIENSPLSTRTWETAVSFLIGETGHVIAAPPRDRYALFPLALAGRRPGPGRAARSSPGSGAGRALGLALGLGVVGAGRCSPPSLARTTWSSATCCRRWSPLLAAVAIGFAADRRPPARPPARARALRLLARLRHPRRPHPEPAATRLPRRHRGARPTPRRTPRDRHLEARRRLGALLPARRGGARLRRIDLDRARSPSCSKPLVATGKPINLPPSFRQVERVRADRLTLNTLRLQDPP